MSASAAVPLETLLEQARRLRFRAAALEEKFCRAHVDEGLVRIRWALASALVFTAISMRSDAVADAGWPEALALSRLVRGGIHLPMWTALLALTWWRPLRRTLDLWIGFSVLVAGATTVPWHTGWFPGGNPHLGLMMSTLPTVLLAALILPVRWRMVLVMVASQAIVCPALYAWVGKPALRPLLVGSLFQNTFYCAVVLVAARMREANERRLFAQREHLAALHAEAARLNADLAAANAQKDRLFAVIGHDLRGPLSAIALGSAVIQRGDASSSVARAGDIHTAARRLLGLLDNLLDWARLQSGLAPAVRSGGVRVADVAAEVLALNEGVARHGGIALSATVPADVVVRADREMLATVLRNLVGNALKAAPAGGRVTLDVAPDGAPGTSAAAEAPAGRVGLRVTDDGAGLAPEKIAALGLARGRAAVADVEATPRGLGLIVCREFAARLGGELWAEPGPDGRGLVVLLALPAG